MTGTPLFSLTLYPFWQDCMGRQWFGCSHCHVCIAPQVGLKVPLIVRLEGTNVEKGKAILKTSEHTIIPADDLDDAAHKAVKSIS